MAVPTYPSSISLNDVQTEFGGANPIAINEYYSGGTYVGSGTANSTGTTIPTTGQISFINFSGAAAVTIKNWWYDQLYPELNSTYYGIYSLAAKLPSSTNAYAVLDVSSPCPAIRVDNGTYANSHWSYDILTGASTFQTGTPISATVSNNDTIVISVLPQAGGRYIQKISSTGTLNFTVNTSNTLYDTLALDGGIYAVGRGAAANSWIANLSMTNGTTINWYNGFHVSGYVWQTGKSLCLYSDKSRIVLLGKAPSGPGCWAFYTANGTFARGSYWSTINSWGSMMTDVRIANKQSANNIMVRFSANPTDYGLLIMEGGAQPLLSTLRKFPGTGNTIQYVTQEMDAATANIYAFSIQNTVEGCIMAKTDINGTGMWAKKISSTRSGNNQVQILSCIATTQEVVVYLRVASMVYDSKNLSWVQTGYLESYVLRIPANGGIQAGTRANLQISNISSVTMSSNGNHTQTSNTPGNTAYTFSFVSNTRTLSSNTNYNINGTVIPT